MGAAGTEHRAKGAKPLQGAAGCQLALPGPKDCINFHVTHGFKQSPASAQALRLIHNPPIFQGRAQLVPCPPQMLSQQGVSQRSSHDRLCGSESGCRFCTSIVPAWRAFEGGMSGSSVHRGGRDSPAVIPAAPSHDDSWEAEQLDCPFKPAPGPQWHRAAQKPLWREPLPAAPPLLSHTLQLLFLHL